MNICVPKERRPFEFRVGMTPPIVQLLARQGHTIYIEHDAGIKAGFKDQDYANAGGNIVYSTAEIFGRADLLCKVARPLRDEIAWLCPEATIAGLLHLASTREEKIRMLREKGISALAYEQIRLPDGTAPVRRPLSEIGGHLAAQIGARLLQSDFDGKGILLRGAPGIPPAEVAILGAGVVGTCATEAFLRLGAHVIVLDSDLVALQRILDKFPGVATLIANSLNIERVCTYTDILIGAVYTPGERAPIVVTREMVRKMKPRSVIMDMSIDEGGCIETSRPTNHQTPTFIEEGVIHYCVPNIPSVVARTSTYALLNAAYIFILEIANKGIDAAIQETSAIQQGIQLYKGELYHW